MHPFVGAMVRALVESGDRTRRLPVQNRLMLRARHQYEEDKRADVRGRRPAHQRPAPQPSPAGSEDILDTMLNAADPLTGERLSDENVRYQMVTFLIAGHETTSGLLSFALYELLRHPEVAGQGARRRSTRCWAARAPRFEHLPRLRLPGPDAEGDAAAVADRPGVQRRRRTRTRRSAAATKSAAGQTCWS